MTNPDLSISCLDRFGFALPIVQLGVSDNQRRKESVETLTDFIHRHEAANELQARRNTARVEAGDGLAGFTMVGLVDTYSQLVTRLGGRPAGAWRHEHLPIVTVCVSAGDADFALLLGQEYWPLPGVGPEQHGIRAASFFVPNLDQANLVLSIHVAHTHDSVLEQPFATCTVSGPEADTSGLAPFAWRHGTTVMTELAESPFPGARQLTHYCDGANEESLHIVIADGEQVWSSSQWLSALALTGRIPPVVVTGIIPREVGTWAAEREQMLGCAEQSARAAFDRAIDAAVAGLGTMTPSTPVMFAGFSLGGVWAIEHALGSPLAYAALGHALCGPVVIGARIRDQLKIRIVDCTLDHSSQTWGWAAERALTDSGLHPQVHPMTARHSWETFAVAVSDYVRDLTHNERS